MRSIVAVSLEMAKLLQDKKIRYAYEYCFIETWGKNESGETVRQEAEYVLAPMSAGYDPWKVDPVGHPDIPAPSFSGILEHLPATIRRDGDFYGLRLLKVDTAEYTLGYYNSAGQALVSHWISGENIHDLAGEMLLKITEEKQK